MPSKANHTSDREKELNEQVHSLLQMAQDKEGYIADLLTIHHRRMLAIKERATSPERPDEMGADILAIIHNPEPSLATAREERSKVWGDRVLSRPDLTAEDVKVLDRIEASVKQARRARLGMEDYNVEDQ